MSLTLFDTRKYLAKKRQKSDKLEQIAIQKLQHPRLQIMLNERWVCMQYLFNAKFQLFRTELFLQLYHGTLFKIPRLWRRMMKAERKGISLLTSSSSLTFSSNQRNYYAGGMSPTSSSVMIMGTGAPPLDESGWSEWCYIQKKHVIRRVQKYGTTMDGLTPLHFACFCGSEVQTIHLVLDVTATSLRVIVDCSWLSVSASNGGDQVVVGAGPFLCEGSRWARSDSPFLDGGWLCWRIARCSHERQGVVWSGPGKV